jgi:hypothetical protein
MKHPRRPLSGVIVVLLLAAPSHAQDIPPAAGFAKSAAGPEATLMRLCQDYSVIGIIVFGRNN